MKDLFTFKQFTINQSKCAMKVGTDGVLLGCWASGGENILDIGTGSGLIALIMAQRFTNAHIDCIDIDSSACTQATKNIRNSHFSSQINIYNCDVQSYSPPYQYDSIVCNPPFFLNSLKCIDNKRSIARHTCTLSPKDLFNHSFRLLTPLGTLSIIIPTEQAEVFFEEAYVKGFLVSKKTFIKTTEKKAAKRILICFVKQKDKLYQEETHTLMINNEKSPWYNKLTGEFYL